MIKTSLKFVALITIFFTVACSPEHDGVTDNSSTDEIITLNPTPDPVLRAAAENILGPKCVSCHGSEGSFQEFLLTLADPGLDQLALDSRYVSPGQSGLSLLAERSSDGSMPPGNPLDAAEAQAIGDWIDDLATVTVFE